LESLDRTLLQSIDAYESKHGSGPTAQALAAELGIPPDFGHHHLVERLKRQVEHGHVSYHRRRFLVTDAGRAALAEAIPEGQTTTS
jgi:hypothetical protein